MTNHWRLTGILAMLVLTVAACGPTTPGGGSPTGGAAPSPTITPVGGTPAGETDGAGTVELSGTLDIWHTYSSGAGTELQALEEVLSAVRTENPGLTVNVTEQPFGELFNKYQLEVAGGAGPDLFIAPNDSLGQLARDELIMPLDEHLEGKLDDIVELALEGSQVDRQMYLVPESLKAVAMYYNADNVETAPGTTDDLLAAVEAGDLRLGLLGGTNIYHNFGWWGAFGGQLMDPSGTCIADQGGVADALAYLQQLQQAGATFYPAYDDMANAFKAGDIDAIVDGPWAAGGYVEAVDNLGVAPMPEGPAGPALPLTGVDGWHVNPNTADPELAVNFALRMTNAEAQEIFANTAYHIPANETIQIDDPISQQFAEAVESGFPRPQVVALNNFWTPFGNALTQVLDQGLDPAQAVTTACQEMNTANEEQ